MPQGRVKASFLAGEGGRTNLMFPKNVDFAKRKNSEIEKQKYFENFTLSRFCLLRKVSFVNCESSVLPTDEKREGEKRNCDRYASTKVPVFTEVILTITEIFSYRLTLVYLQFHFSELSFQIRSHHEGSSEKKLSVKIFKPVCFLSDQPETLQESYFILLEPIN